MGLIQTISVSVFSAFIGGIVASLVERHHTRLGLRETILKRIRRELYLSERMAHIARRLLVSMEVTGDRVDRDKIEDELFSSVLDESELTALSAELKSYQIDPDRAVCATHRLRQELLEKVMDFQSGSNALEAELYEIQQSTKKHSEKYTDLIKTVYHRFQWAEWIKGSLCGYRHGIRR